MKKNKKNLSFWQTKPNGILGIIHSRLIKFLESKGYANVELSKSNYKLVRIKKNRMSEASYADIGSTVKKYLKSLSKDDVYEAFARASTTFLSKNKLMLLKTVNVADDRDGKDNSYFYFQNIVCKVTKSGIETIQYADLNFMIWENRILKRDFNMPSDLKKGQFECFVHNIAKGSNLKKASLNTVIGYLLHRNKDREIKAILLYDEKMGLSGMAHGGTGKTLLCQAIKQCRELEIFDGKSIKTGSWFRNQRIELTTDIIVFDDLHLITNFDSFFPMITSGIEVEKKRQQAFFIEADKTPKLVITSNYYVQGPGGSSDERRRYEFKLANYYDLNRTPETEFGNRFFNKYWSDDEWNKFYRFMMNCTQQYLNSGLLEDPTDNLKQSKIQSTTSAEFVEFSDKNLKYNTWIDKRNFQEKFNNLYPKFKNDVSVHQFSKWLKTYAVENNANYNAKSTGGNYLFKVEKRE